MKLSMRAMLIAGGTGLVIKMLISVIGLVLGYLPGQVMGDPTSVDPEKMASYLELSGGLFLVGVFLCCFAYILDGAIGVFYGWLAHKDQGVIEIGSAASGGGIITGIIAIIVQVAGQIYSLVAGPLVQEMVPLTELASDELGAIAAVAVGTTVVCCCISFILSVGFGATGGVIYAAIAGSGQS
jgi:hypothetical protein